MKLQFKISPEARQRFRDAIIEQLKGAAIKAAIKAFLGSAGGVGIKAWLVKFIATELFEEVAEPIAKAVIIEGEYRLQKLNGRLEIKRLKEASNASDYDSAADDILS